MSIQRKWRRIRTSNLCFIRRSLQLLGLPIGCVLVDRLLMGDSLDLLQPSGDDPANDVPGYDCLNDCVAGCPDQSLVDSSNLLSIEPAYHF